MTQVQTGPDDTHRLARNRFGPPARRRKLISTLNLAAGGVVATAAAVGAGIAAAPAQGAIALVGCAFHTAAKCSYPPNHKLSKASESTSQAGHQLCIHFLNSVNGYYGSCKSYNTKADMLTINAARYKAFYGNTRLSQAIPWNYVDVFFP